jgi:hypothetical protein
MMMATIPRSINNNLNTGIIEKADGVFFILKYLVHYR